MRLNIHQVIVLIVALTGCHPPSGDINSGLTSIQKRPSIAQKNGNDKPGKVTHIRYTEADLEYKRAFSDATGRALSVERQGDAEVLAGRYAEAEAIYRRAIGMSPKFEGSNTVVSEAPYKMARMFLYLGKWQKSLDAVLGQTKHGEMTRVDPIACICYVELGDLDRARACAPLRINDSNFDECPENLPPPFRTPDEWKAASYFHIANDIGRFDELTTRYTDKFYALACNAYPDVVPYSYEYGLFLRSEKYLMEAKLWFERCRTVAKGSIVRAVDLNLYEMSGSIAWGKYRTR